MKHLVYSILSLLLLFCSCSTTRRLKEGEYLLARNVIVDKSASLFELNPDIEESEFESYIRQKPNRKVLIMRLHLRIYNMVNEEKMNRQKERREKKVERVNKKRAEKEKKRNEWRAKKNKAPVKIRRKKNRLTFREWLRSIGEAPVVFDSAQMEKSARQIKLFMNNKGYFNSTVRDSVAYKDKKATVYYIITPNQPYLIRQVSYEIKDDQLAYFIFSDSTASLVRSGNNYDVDVLQDERERITRNMKNNGYYFFSKEFIYYKIDSSLNSHQVDVVLGIKNPLIRLNEQSDSLLETSHKRFYLGNIYVITDYNPKSQPKTPRDTLLSDSIYILSSGELKYKPKVLTSALYIHPGELYQSKNSDATYNRLSDLKAFRLVNIVYEPRGDYLDCYIQLSPVMKQSFTIEAEGTNTGENRGVAGNFIYQNRNVFKGAEILDAKLKVGLEIQKLSNETGDGTIISGSEIPFNTLEIGPEVSLTIPRALLPGWRILQFSQNANPKTIFATSYNYQVRPDFERAALIGSWGYMWRESPTARIAIYPLELNYVFITPSQKFSEYLNTIDDPLYVYRFTDHITTDMRFSYIFSNQGQTRKRSFKYFRWNGELSGLVLRSYFNIRRDLFGQDSYSVDGGYTLGAKHIRFSHYARTDIDWRYYFRINKHTQFVFRSAIGVGKPFINFRELPLEKSFFGGGPNGIRAWKARTLGPGSFRSLDETNFDKLGDAQIEFNAEYRFNVFKMLNAALFVDAGNIWLRKFDPNRPGGEFRLTTFYKEFAVGSGIGIRLDFDFFIIRFDLGIKMVDPSFGLQGRFVAGHLFDKEWKSSYEAYYGERYSFLNFNFGIGYPF
ncbi:MAG: BamA/TamA family outer membrane protein [Bacteroidota bacterium]